MMVKVCCVYVGVRFGVGKVLAVGGTRRSLKFPPKRDLA
jgi:hypothetical protein